MNELLGNLWAFICDIEPWTWVVIFGIIQVSFFIETRLKLNHFKGYFSDSHKWTVEKNDDYYSIVVGNSSKGMDQLIEEINEYLRKNEGTADFGIIKDKVQSRLDSLYEDATSKISFPTYLGLMGTFFGVWIGLSSFKDGVEINGVTNTIVADLIGGVIVSMITSLVGLFLMMIGNASASIALKRVEEDKNKFFDFIQVNLMPMLGTSMVSALNKLHQTVNTFEPAFRGIIGEFKDAFGECTESLRGAFGEKVQLLSRAVETMGENMSLVNENVKQQDQLLRLMGQKETLKTLQNFTAAADKFDAVTTSICKLSEVKDEIATSSTQLVEAQSNFVEQMLVPERVFEKINSILNRVVSFEDSLNALGADIAQTQLLGNTQMNFIQDQITAIKKKTDLTIQYQEISEDELKKVYRSQTETIAQLNHHYNTEIEEHGNEIANVMRGFKSEFAKIVKECMDAVESLRNEYFAEIHKALDFDATNQHLAKLDDIPGLLKTLTKVQTYQQEQPDVYAKISSLSDQIYKIQDVLEMMDKKISFIQRIPKTQVPVKKKKQAKLFGLFRKK